MPMFTVRGPVPLPTTPSGNPGELFNNPSTVDLSNGNLTATANATAVGGPLAGAISRSFTSHSSGKFCFGVTYGPTTADSGGQGSGICNPSEPNTNYAGSTNNSVGMEQNYFGASNVYINDTALANPVGTGGFGGGTLIFAVDVDGKFMCISYNNGSSWYGNTGFANADPLTGVNCIDLSVIATPWSVAIDTFTISKTLTAILTSVSGKPSGFLDWG